MAEINNLQVRVHVDMDSLRRHKQHCPIANSLILFDDDITHPWVDRNEISFSRRSTGQRYTYQTPMDAKEFIDKVDDANKEGEVTELEDFIFTLDRPLKSKPRTQRNASAAIRRVGQRARGFEIKSDGGTTKMEEKRQRVLTVEGEKSVPLYKEPHRRPSERVPFSKST